MFKTGRVVAVTILILSGQAATAEKPNIFVVANGLPAQLASVSEGSIWFPPAIATFDLETGAMVASYVAPRPESLFFGRGVAVLDGEIFYTDVHASGRFSDGIHVVSLTDPTKPERLLQDPGGGTVTMHLAAAHGVLYTLSVCTHSCGRVLAAITGLDPATGAVVKGPVTDYTFGQSPGFPFAGGFTFLPNGNFLLGRGCLYDEYDSTTGSLIPRTTIAVPGGLSCTGVTTDRGKLYFQTANGIVQTNPAGHYQATYPVAVGNCVTYGGVCIQGIAVFKQHD